LRKRTLAALVAPFALGASGIAGAAGQGGTAAATATAATPTQYSVINLDPEGGGFPLLNENGQAAVSSFLFRTNRFFDGDRLHELGSLGGSFTVARSLNNRGVVVGESQDNSPPFGEVYAFKYTVADGMRALPNSAGGSARDINDNNQVVGYVRIPGAAGRAVRWDPNGKVVNLGPLPLSGSEAHAINNQGFAGGFTDVAGGDIHAAVWDPAGRQTDLGSLGASIAFTDFVNERNEVAGDAEPGGNENLTGFFWSARDGIVKTGALGAGRLVVALNDRGEIAGDTNVRGGRGAYLWSRANGLRVLPRGGAVETDVFDMNNNTQLVGRLLRADGSTRAVRWNGVSNPVDLNTLLYRPPAGLVLEAAAAVNDAGAILAYSNAGMVMLRPGTKGTDAPVLGPVTGLPATLTAGQNVRLAVGFTDNSLTQTHKAVVTWTDNCTSPHPLVREARGVGEVSFQHRFCKPGYYFLTVQVTDSGGRTTDVRREIVVNDPGLAAVSGQGTLARAHEAPGARALPLRFALWAPAASAAAAKSGASEAGAPYFGLSGAIQFRSEQVGTPVIKGQQVHLEGTGLFMGRPGYRFVIDTDRGDRMRVRISHTESGGKEVVDYDNGNAGGNASGNASKDGLDAAPPAEAGAPDRTVIAEGGLTLS
jgi:uncharacterized membrane protein